jgi:hypothetical protein
MRAAVRLKILAIQAKQRVARRHAEEERAAQG